MPMEPPPDLASLSLADIARLAGEKRLPPVDKWNPRHCGNSDMRTAREQAARFARAGKAPLGGALGVEAEESLVIFGVAYQHHRAVLARGLRGIERAVHQRFAKPDALPDGIDRNRPDHHHRRSLAIVADDFDRPALDRADQIVFLDRSEAQ